MKSAMARLAVLGACLAVAGCSGDPESSRLSVGQKAMAIPHNKEHDKVYLGKPSNNFLASLVPGTHVTVVSDDDAKDWSSRNVLIHVEDGEFRGVSGQATRWDLVPE